MSANEKAATSTLSRETILRALQTLSDGLGEQATAGGLPQFPHLRLTMPVPEYLLAMKCMAARIGGTTEEPTDVADIIFLIRHLELSSAREVLDLVAQYYPANRIPAKTQYLVEGLFEEGKV